MSILFNGTAGTFRISEPELFVDNKTRGRSGHMTHAIVEYEPGKILDFNSNCSKERLSGHSAFGWVEYRRSEDYGESWSEFQTLPYSMEILLNGVHTISVEKAVAVNGFITAFALRNDQTRPICCEPWDTPLYLRSNDGGMSWSKPEEFSPYKGRIYDAVVKDDVIYVLESCNTWFVGAEPEDVYRLFTSHDGGKTFQECSIIDIESKGHGYGALQFLKDGTLAAYSCNIGNGKEIAVSLSSDLGKSWKQLPPVTLTHGIRNIQISNLRDGFIMHGRAWSSNIGVGFVMYSSKDGLEWDDGIILEPDHSMCYYSNNHLIRKPDGTEKLLVQYSDNYTENCCGAQVNVMHLTVEQV